MTQNQMHSGQLYTNVAPVKPVVKDNTLNQVNHSKRITFINIFQYDNNLPSKHNISQRHEMPPNETPPTRRDVKPSIEQKPRGQRSLLFQSEDPSHSRNNSEDSNYKVTYIL